MADIAYGFNSVPWGGTINYILPLESMPDFSPVGESVKENMLRGNNGKIWKYTWYRKETQALAFTSVGTAILNVMRGLAVQGVPFLWHKDVYNGGGTGTMVYTGGPFSHRPYSPGIIDFTFQMEELE